MWVPLDYAHFLLNHGFQKSCLGHAQLVFILSRVLLIFCFSFLSGVTCCHICGIICIAGYPSKKPSLVPFVPFPFPSLPSVTFLPTVPRGGTVGLQMDFFFSFSFISFSTPPILGVGWDCTVLYCVLYCTVLYWIVLYCTVLYCIVLYCTVLYCIVLYCTVLYCTILYCTGLYCTVLYCTVKKKKKSHPPQKKNHPPKKITPTPPPSKKKKKKKNPTPPHKKKSPPPPPQKKYVQNKGG